MFDLDDLVGLPYELGRDDCFSCVRNFYRKCGLQVPNFARPAFFWQDPNMDLYALYKDFGFKHIFDQEPEPGDLLLMPILARVNSHAAVSLGNNQILHHPPGQLSRVDPYRPKWANRTTVHARNSDIHEFLKPVADQIHLHEVLDAHILRNPRVQREIETLVSDRR